MICKWTSVLAALAVLPLGGCVGTQSVGFFATDNLGLNVATQPDPTAEINFSRREGVIEPTYGRGAVPAVAAAILHDTSDFWLASQSSMGVYSGGNAAVAVARSGAASSTNGQEAVACMANKPAGISESKAGDSATGLLFGTDTSIGFKITAPLSPSGVATASFPNVHFGYRRNEIAIASVMGMEKGCDDVAYSYGVYSPSFLAVVNNNLQVGAPPVAPASTSGNNVTGTTGTAGATGTGTQQSTTSKTASFTIGQVFATGKAAELIAQDSTFNGVIAKVAGAVAAKSATASVDITGDQVIKSVFDQRKSISEAVSGLTTALGKLKTSIGPTGATGAKADAAASIEAWNAAVSDPAKPLTGAKAAIAAAVPFGDTCVAKAVQYSDAIQKDNLATLTATAAEKDGASIKSQTTQAEVGAWLSLMKTRGDKIQKALGKATTAAAAATEPSKSASPNTVKDDEFKAVTAALADLKADGSGSLPPPQASLCPAPAVEAGKPALKAGANKPT